MLDAQSEEVLDLCAGDQDGNAVGEAEHYWTRDELHRSAQSGGAHDEQQDAGHHGAHEQAVDPVLGDDCRYHHDKRPGRPANLHP